MRWRRSRTSQSQGEAGDHVAQPVHVEKHAAAGDHDDEPNRDPGDSCPDDPATAAGEQQRRCGEEGSGPRRVAARERRSERFGDRVQGRPHAIGELFDRRRRGCRFRPTTMSRKGTTHTLLVPHGLGHGQDDRQRYDHDRLAEVRDGVEAVRRERGGVPVAPIRHALVQLHEISAAAHQVGEYSEQYAAAHDHDQREGQRKTGCGPRIEHLGERSCQDPDGAASPCRPHAPCQARTAGSGPPRPTSATSPRSPCPRSRSPR